MVNLLLSIHIQSSVLSVRYCPFSNYIQNLCFADLFLVFFGDFASQDCVEKIIQMSDYILHLIKNRKNNFNEEFNLSLN